MILENECFEISEKGKYDLLYAPFCSIQNERLTMLQKVATLYFSNNDQLQCHEKLANAHALINFFNEYLFVSVFLSLCSQLAFCQCM